MATTIKLIPDGPLQISGTGKKLIDPQGNEYDVSDKKDLFLCRCGASKKKPYCDGSHKAAGFEGSGPASPP